MSLDRLATALADRYQIIRELGAGGMATVYLAQDLRHDRRVAVKVLRPELAAVIGAERFLAEIRTTANLQHPHILPLHDSGEADAFLFYVMPFIEGETVRDRLSREKQLPIADAVRIATEVAAALDYAHRRGVIHRDIKPENILLHDGQALVADFGIALAASTTGGTRMTETGMSLGTPHYMSPEQAMGEREITARSDVYALGAVTYEMLLGEPPFSGPTAQAIVSKVLTEKPPPLVVRRDRIPAHVEDAVLTALEKLPADRFGSAREFADALRGEDGTAARRPTLAGRSAAPGTGKPAGRPVALLGALVLASGLAAWGWLRPAPAPPVTRYQFAVPPSQAWLPNFPPPTPSADGSFLLYHGPLEGGAPGVQLWIKRRDSHTATPVAGTVNVQGFAVSPDGAWIAFATGRQLRKVLLTGGASTTLVPDGVVPNMGVAWLADGTIVFARDALLSPIPFLVRIADGGGETTIFRREDQFGSIRPVPLPGGRGLLFTRCSPVTTCDLWSVGLDGENARELLPGVGLAHFAPTGHLVYVHDGRLLAVGFDPVRREIRGQQVLLADGVEDARLSASGTLVTRLGTGRPGTGAYQMVWVDRTGRETPVDTAWRFQVTTAFNNHGWALSPNGSRLAIGLTTDAGDDIWVKALPRGAVSRLSFGPRGEFRPRWTPDGGSIIYLADGTLAGVYRRRADATGSDSLLVSGILNEALPSPDGEWLLLRQGATGPSSGGRDITGIRLGQDTVPVPVIATRFDETAIAFSPDGRWLTYQSDETGRTEVFLRSFPDTEAFKRQVSNGGGGAPLWSRDGRELFYLSAAKQMMAVRVSSGAPLTLGDPVALFRVPDELLAVESVYYTPWDVGTDGRFIMARIRRDAGQSAPVVVITENWLTELQARMPR